MVKKYSEHLQHVLFIFDLVLHVRVPYEICKLIRHNYFMWIVFTHEKKSHIVVIRSFEGELFVWKFFYKSVLP